MLCLIHRLTAFLWIAAMLVAPLYVCAQTSESKLLVINALSTKSEGADSILWFDSAGDASVFVGDERNILGMRGLACSPIEPHHIFVGVSHFDARIFEVWEFNSEGERVRIIGGFASGNLMPAFDTEGNLFVANDGKVFKNGAVFATLCTECGLGDIGIDSKGNIYVTEVAVNSQLYRVDPLGNVTLLADANDGLKHPFGIAIDSQDNVFVSNNPPSEAAFILKFSPKGSITTFASGISFQPGIRDMAFDSNNNLYVGLAENRIILKYDTSGNSTVFADASDGATYPASLEFVTCPVEPAGIVVVIEIDIKPGGNPNSINPKSKGKIPVAILSTETFDATTVDSTTVFFGASGTEASPVHVALKDVDGDKETDMILHFKTQQTGIRCGDGAAMLKGETLGGQLVEGSASIKTVGCKPKGFR